MNKIKVSVIMPVYNSGKYLKKAVESILNQSDERLELILVDDGSTDGSANVCDDYALRMVELLFFIKKWWNLQGEKCCLESRKRRIYRFFRS